MNHVEYTIKYIIVSIHSILSLKQTKQTIFNSMTGRKILFEMDELFMENRHPAPVVTSDPTESIFNSQW